MRRFSSYGPVDKDIHYYVPRTELLNKIKRYLIGEVEEKGGHYVTIWAPRQTGKTWLLLQIYWELKNIEKYFCAKIDLQHLKKERDTIYCINSIIDKINDITGLNLNRVANLAEFQEVFRKEKTNRPLILILDEFDSLEEEVINDLVSVFRNIYLNRKSDLKSSFEKDYMLHGLALIGIRSALGIENPSGSPFNVQKSIHIPNLTREEVYEMYRWYERESGQKVGDEVIERIYHATQGQPGLVSWFGELLTDEYALPKEEPITMKHFNFVYSEALSIQPNNNIINLISKAQNPEYRPFVLSMFKTDEKVTFELEDPICSYLYMNGIIGYERIGEQKYAKFSCQFVQEKLFRRFSRELFFNIGKLLVDPFIEIEEIVNEKGINVAKMIVLYGEYFKANRNWILERAERRSDGRIYEAIYHFNLFAWLQEFLKRKRVYVQPEFPTGNGKIDILLFHPNKIYGLELKSFMDISELKISIQQAGRYGRSLGLEEIYLVEFIEITVPERIKKEYEQPKFVQGSNINVKVIFVEVV